MTSHTTRERDGCDWCIGVPADIAWLHPFPRDEADPPLPPLFEGIAGVRFPAPLPGAQRRHDLALAELLRASSPAQAWWLGYLDTGKSEDLVFFDVPTVTVDDGFEYVLVLAGVEQAIGWRPSEGRSAPWRGALPELMFPEDRSWLLYTPWDDRCTYIGGPDAVLADLRRDPELGARTDLVWPRAKRPDPAGS